MLAHIFLVNNLFDQKKGKEIFQIDYKTTIRDWLTQRGVEEFTAPTICLFNGKALLRKEWESTVICNNDHVVFTTLLQGEDFSGGGKILGTIVAISISLITAFLTGGTSLVLTDFMKGVITVGGAVVGALADYGINQAFKTNPLAEKSDSYSLQGNMGIAKLGSSIPVIYGKHIVVPPLLNESYIHFENNEQYTNAYYCIGQGEYELNDIRIDDTSYKDSDVLEYKMLYAPRALQSDSIVQHRNYTCPESVGIAVEHFDITQHVTDAYREDTLVVTGIQISDILNVLKSVFLNGTCVSLVKILTREIPTDPTGYSSSEDHSIKMNIFDEVVRFIQIQDETYTLPHDRAHYEALNVSTFRGFVNREISDALTPILNTFVKHNYENWSNNFQISSFTVVPPGAETNEIYIDLVLPEGLYQNETEEYSFYLLCEICIPNSNTWKFLKYVKIENPFTKDSLFKTYKINSEKTIPSGSKIRIFRNDTEDSTIVSKATINSVRCMLNDVTEKPYSPKITVGHFPTIIDLSEEVTSLINEIVVSILNSEEIITQSTIENSAQFNELIEYFFLRYRGRGVGYTVKPEFQKVINYLSCYKQDYDMSYYQKELSKINSDDIQGMYDFIKEPIIQLILTDYFKSYPSIQSDYTLFLSEEMNNKGIYVDISLPEGLCQFVGNEGSSEQQSYTIDLIFEKKIFNENEYTWEYLNKITITGNTTNPIKRTYVLSSDVLPSQSEVKIRVRRLDKKVSNSLARNKVVIDSIYTVEESVKNIYKLMGDVTILEVKMLADSSLPYNAMSLLNCIVTRKLKPAGQEYSMVSATTKISDALYDVLTSKYGANLRNKNELDRIDTDSLLALESEWTNENKSFNAVFDQSITVWEALSKIAMCGNAFCILQGGVIHFIRDALQIQKLPVALFSSYNIVKDSLNISYVMHQDYYDRNKEIEYFSEDTWKLETIHLSTEKKNNNSLSRMFLFGVTNKSQATELGYHVLDIQSHRRKVVSFQTELEGLIPTIGDIISISHEIPSWGEHGFILSYEYENKVITVSQEFNWSHEPEKQHYVVIKKYDGTLDGPLKVKKGENTNQVVLEEDHEIVLSPEKEPMQILFGDIKNVFSTRAVVFSIKPKEGLVEINAFIDNRYTAFAGIEREGTSKFGISKIYAHQLILNSYGHLLEFGKILDNSSETTKLFKYEQRQENTQGRGIFLYVCAIIQDNGFPLFYALGTNYKLYRWGNTDHSSNDISYIHRIFDPFPSINFWKIILGPKKNFFISTTGDLFTDSSEFISEDTVNENASNTLYQIPRVSHVVDVSVSDVLNAVIIITQFGDVFLLGKNIYKHLDTLPIIYPYKIFSNAKQALVSGMHCFILKKDGTLWNIILKELPPTEDIGSPPTEDIGSPPTEDIGSPPQRT